ncbi:MAG: hypothetical protein WC796_05370 [Candidatus Pacearchaeota archaeon]|jgi:hypothetical protein
MAQDSNYRASQSEESANPSDDQTAARGTAEEREEFFSRPYRGRRQSGREHLVSDVWPSFGDEFEDL